MTDQPSLSTPAAASTPSPIPAGPPRRSRAKIVLIVIAVLVGLGLIAGTIAWRMTAGAVDAADRFLTTTATEGPRASWAIASPGFQQSAPADAWDAFARQSGLTGYKSSSWTNREVSNNVARIQGSVTTQSGATIPMSVDLVRTGGTWLVQTIRMPQSGFQSGASGLQSQAPATPPIGAGQQAPSSSSASSSWQSPAPAAPVAAGASIPGAKVAGTCMTMLQEQAGTKFDSIQCLSDLPARVGATTLCSIAKDTRHGQMTATVTSVDPVTQSVNFHCSAGGPM